MTFEKADFYILIGGAGIFGQEYVSMYLAERVMYPSSYRFNFLVTLRSRDYEMPLLG
jgi:hypothetical protein